MAWIAVAVGGALGSVARHAVNRWSAAQWPTFPAGTLLVNLAGCFVIGFLAGLIAVNRINAPLHWREFVFVGVLGGFTTFSTFGLDTLVLARTHPVSAAMNVALQVGVGLLAVWIGYRFGAG